MDVIEIEKNEAEEKVLSILDNCIAILETFREKLRKEIYYDELY